MTPRFFRFAWTSSARRYEISDDGIRSYPVTSAGWYWYETDASGDALDIDQYVGPFPSYDAAFYAAGMDPMTLGSQAHRAAEEWMAAAPGGVSSP